jgi:Zn-dependent alcohol dehydrogenase
MQALFEKLALEMMDYYLGDIIRETGKIAFAGGCALNVKLNQKIIAREEVKELFVQPASGDAGTAVGAAAYISHQRGVPVEKMEHVYLGPSFSNEDVIAACARHPNKPAWQKIDNVPERLSMARAGGAITINFDEESVLERLKELTRGKGPEKCIDSVGMEAHAARSIDSMYDRAKQALMMETDRPHVLREMIYVCRPAGIISIPGVYGGLIDKIPFGAAMNKGLTFRMGQTHVNRWTDDLLKRIQEGQIDPSFVITHSVSLEQGPEMYKTFRDKHDGCIKVVLKP